MLITKPDQRNMKRIYILTVALLPLLIFNGKAKAQSLETQLLTTQIESRPAYEALKILEPPAPEKPPESIVVEYTIKENDSLTTIAEAHQTTVQRLWEKNINLTDPDLIEVGVKLVVPGENEQLVPRAMPVPPPRPVQQPSSPRSKPVFRPVARGASTGNTYSYGYCTWYVKNRRPDLPNNLGNADTWTIRARNQGIPTGTTPSVGAVGQQGMHVVYVESVNGSQMTISEMNFKGWNIKSSRTVSWSGWNFIY